MELSWFSPQVHTNITKFLKIQKLFPVGRARQQDARRRVEQHRREKGAHTQLHGSDKGPMASLGPSTVVNGGAPVSADDFEEL